MDHRFLALTEPVPPGFVFRSELTRAELRRSAFAIYASDFAIIEAALASAHGRMAGVLITPAERLHWEHRGADLYHLGVPVALLDFLADLLRPHLALLAKISDLADANLTHALNLTRAAEDRSRLVREFGDLRENLWKEIGERRAAEAELREARDELELRVQQRTADLTQSHAELKRAQLQLIQAEKMQSVGNLAAGIAHEVKNPLAILEMGIGCLTRRDDLDPESLTVVLREMEEAVGRANSVISGLLDYSSSKELDIRESNLNTVLEHSLRLMKHELIHDKIAVLREFSPENPVCRIDAQKIEQVLINLLTNACHAMPQGGTLTARTAFRSLDAGDVHWDAGDRSGSRFREDERVAVVTIQDTGTGIPADKLEKIFDPFFTTKPTGQGTGLGLTVARKIIALHEGRLEIANAAEGGVVATITLKSDGKFPL